MLRSLAVVGLVAAVSLACKEASDCSHNGQCVQGACECRPAFAGPTCGKFAFDTLDESIGTGLRTVFPDGQQVSSWGGTIHRHDDGKYHMWAAEMVNFCGIKTWISNSQVVHAVAEDPDRPWEFQRKETVFPVFAHEPTVSRAPSGEYVMFYSTNYGQKRIPCTGYSCHGFNGTSDLSCPNDQQCTISEPLLTFMSYASDPDGPWSTPVRVPTPDGADTNMACLIREDSSITCMARPAIGMFNASNWRDVSAYKNYMPNTLRVKPDGVFRGEDPMMWRDERGVYHSVLHGGGWESPFGYAYWSLDGVTWHGDNDVKVYENIVETTGGGPPMNLSRRERPHVVFGKDGTTPIALSNGITQAWPCTLVPKPVPGSNGTGILCPNDYCWTLVQPLKGWKEAF